ncbi:amidohydrolase family protein [Tateyamaria omphalii]|uniref:amidohydrolase family protein n=1 Tax=Tateyamaria omphalii TaxID=299262 RepID=UPI001C9A0AB2|nr:amidohydrolase family protein [Tateyamaria omphalii]MBY5932063.1 amidohydrolase family protein [Tateyamaria omphalii]
MDSAPPPPAPTSPETKLPAGAWDAHVHLLGGPEHPLSPTRAQNPPEDIDFDGWLSRYSTHLEALGCTHSLIVHSILYGTDNTVTLEAVRAMGKGFKGVGLLPDGAATKDVKHFADNNIVAVRLNYVHGGVLTWEGAKAMAPALADHGMHIQMLLHADKHIEELANDIRALPVPLVIDHCGWPTDLNPNTKAIDTLCALLAEGHAYIKLSAPYRLTDNIAETHSLMRRLIDANPDRCLWGSDWPHIMLNGAQMPQAAKLADSLSSITTEEERQKIFVDAPNTLFAP